MKILLLMGLTMVCGVQALQKSMEYPQNMTGNWFTVALASNVTSKIQKGGSLEIFIKNVTEENGHLVAYFFRRENNKCIEFGIGAIKGEDGQKIAPYNGINTYSLRGMDSKHAMYILHNYNSGKITIWAELFGRTPDLSDEIKKEFEEMCERFGIRKDRIRYLSSEDQCEELR